MRWRAYADWREDAPDAWGLRLIATKRTVHAALLAEGRLGHLTGDVERGTGAPVERLAVAGSEGPHCDEVPPFVQEIQPGPALRPRPSAVGIMVLEPAAS
ncbi:hypothetical protein ACQEVG_35440 [Streptomyces sp. CA-135486]|uniref:hypothetical protein n=1 Tax=Streptomyces sp. CA-135486 TaxID=3240049 RepID=UPI003D8B00F3